MAKGKKFGLGIILGAVAGVVTGLLTAPKSGKETREDIKNKAGEIKGSAERKLKEAHKELGKLSDEAKLKAKELQGKAKEETEELGKKADELKERVKAAITSIKSGDDDNDDATIDQLLKDLAALKNKITTKVKNATK
ncbi:MAG: YtxH domain-containing protein [Candidatus Saccharimonadales bacterium]